MEYIIKYECAKTSYERSLASYSRILTQKEELFQRTQPKAIAIDPDRVQGSGDSNPLEAYMVRKEELQIDARIEEARSILMHREELYRQTERILRASNGTWVRIYVDRYLDNDSVAWISRQMHFSKRNIYKILERIRKKSAQKFTNSMLL